MTAPYHIYYKGATEWKKITNLAILPEYINGKINKINVS